MKRILRALSAISFALLLEACAGLPPDKPLCTELTPTRAYCVNTMSGADFEVNEVQKLDGKTWWEMRPTNIQMPSQTWKAFKVWINKICKNNSQCDSAVANWERTVNKIDAAAP